MPTTRYQIRVQGHLRPEWTKWFDDMTIAHETNSTTTLSGPVADQAALHGLLIKVRNLGLELIASGLQPLAWHKSLSTDRW